MNPIRQLQEKRGSLMKQAREILDEAAKENRGLTVDEKSKFDGIENDLTQLQETYDAEVRQLQRESQNAPKLTEKEERDFAQFSVARALRCVLSGSVVDGLEGEMHQQAVKEARDSGITLRGAFAIPAILTRAGNRENRDLTVTGGSNGEQGGALVETRLGSFIELLYSKMVLRNLGAQFLTGLTGNFALPKMLTGSTVSHKPEVGALDESSPTFGQVLFSPNRVGGYIEYSKQLLLQSAVGIEGLLRNDLATRIALAMEAGAIYGTGINNQPLGILGTSGIGSVAGGTNGAAPTLDHLIALETAVAMTNADVGSLGYLTNVAVRGKLKRTPIESGTSAERIWGQNSNSMLNGYKVEVTNQVPSNLTKGSASGVASAIIFGNWADLVIAQWGGIDIQVNPYIKDIEGLVRITADTFYDTGVRRPESFAVMADALTV